MKKPLENTGGFFREVQVYKTLVIKQTKNHGGVSNENELKIYRNFGKRYKVFCPVMKKSTAEKIYMPRAIPLGWNHHSKEVFNSPIYLPDYCLDALGYFINHPKKFSEELTKEEAREMVNSFVGKLAKMKEENSRLEAFLVNDLHGGNIGIRGKHLEIIDYGGCGSFHFEERREK